MTELEYLQKKLLEQLDLLIQAAESYDRGKNTQALHIATILRTLFSPTKKGKGPLFRILRIVQREILLDSTIPPFNKPPLMLIGLVDYVVRKGHGEVVPHLDGDQHPEGEMLRFGSIVAADGGKSSFEINLVYQRPLKKWLKEAIFILSPKHLISRQYLFETAANQDGGAHVDTELDPLYDRLKSLGGTNVEFRLTPDAPPLRFSDVPYPALRQIAFEVITSPAVRALTG
jgi:hypothetical protein